MEKLLYPRVVEVWTALGADLPTQIDLALLAQRIFVLTRGIESTLRRWFPSLFWWLLVFNNLIAQRDGQRTSQSSSQSSK